MTMQLNPNEPIDGDTARDAVLIDFAEAIGKETGGRSVLAQYAAQYPDLARDFGRIAAESHWGGLPSTATDSETAGRFRAIGLAALQSARPALAPSVAVSAAPLQSLIDAAKARGLSRQDLASRLLLPDTLLLKLHRRLIEAASIPGELIEKIADAVGRTNDEITAYLRQPAQMPMGASFRSDTAPQTQTETFADALQNDPDATPEQKAAWQSSGVQA